MRLPRHPFERRPNKRPLLILMVGLPRAGKTTIAKRSIYPVVSGDAVRRSFGHRFYPPIEPIVWSTQLQIARCLDLAGHTSLVIDDCNGTRKRRDWWREHLPNHDAVACYVATDKDLCLERSDDVLRHVIERMAAEFQPPIELPLLAPTDLVTLPYMAPEELNFDSSP